MTQTGGQPDSNISASDGIIIKVIIKIDWWWWNDGLFE
jgi:hypothetical protein